MSEGRLGIVVVGGLNPVAILEEKGIPVFRTGALAGLMDYGRLFRYEELAIAPVCSTERRRASGPTVGKEKARKTGPFA